MKINKRKVGLRHPWVKLLAQIMLLWCSTAQATVSIGAGQAAQNVATNLGGVGFMLWMASIALGFGFAIWGLVKVGTAHRSREPATGGWMLVLFGALLVAAPTVVAMTQTTVFGSSSSTSALAQLKIGG